RHDASDALERGAQLGVLLLELRGSRQVLQRAAAADAEVRAARRDAYGCGLEHLEKLGLIVLAAARVAAEAHQLPGQRAGAEGGLAAVPAPLPLRCESGAGSGLLGRRCAQAAVGAAHEGASHTCRNSAKCGSRAARR